MKFASENEHPARINSVYLGRRGARLIISASKKKINKNKPAAQNRQNIIFLGRCFFGQWGGRVLYE